MLKTAIISKSFVSLKFFLTKGENILDSIFLLLHFSGTILKLSSIVLHLFIYNKTAIVANNLISIRLIIKREISKQ